jgi:putative SOS response-associated peptidase YedK
VREYLQKAFDIDDLPETIRLPRYNMAPGQTLVTVLNDGKRHRVGEIKWGFVPAFAKDEKIGYSMINAKSETLAEKPSYKDSFRSRRCVVLADGFYEWKTDGSSKQPYRFHMGEGTLFALAGLWTQYVKEDGSKLFTCTIITTQANEDLADLHDRMPVILEGEDLSTWLNPNATDLQALTKILKPFPGGRLVRYPVSNLVNKPQNDSPDCIKPLKD